MRLILKTSIYFLLAMIPVLSGGGYFLYKYFNHELRHIADEELVFDKLHWEKFIRNRNNSSQPFVLYSPEIIIRPCTNAIFSKPILKDTTILQEFEKEYDPYRQLFQIVSIRDIHYSILIRKSLLEKRDLINHITRVMSIVFLAVFFMILLLNWFINRNIWTPFYKTLHQLGNLQLLHLEEFTYKETSTKEFNDLNRAIETMAKKINQDYKTLKEFTEDAAHEMQTPLTIAQNKLEILMQSSNLGESQLNTILETIEALERLTKLNHSLLLLAKIENLQFSPFGILELNLIIDKYLKLFQEFLENKKIEIHKINHGIFQLEIHSILADSLISNLLGNAIKYNFEGGMIWIIIEKDSIIFRNSSQLKEIDASKLYKRFKKTEGSSHNSSPGLGLAIAKKIADTHNLDFQYTFFEGIQDFKLVKKTN